MVPACEPRALKTPGPVLTHGARYQGLPLQRGATNPPEGSFPAEPPNTGLMSKHEPRPSQAAAGSPDDHREPTHPPQALGPAWTSPSSVRFQPRWHHSPPKGPVLLSLQEAVAPPRARLWGSPAGAEAHCPEGTPCPGPSGDPGDAGDTRRGDLTGASPLAGRICHERGHAAPQRPKGKGADAHSLLHPCPHPWWVVHLK